MGLASTSITKFDDVLQSPRSIALHYAQECGTAWHLPYAGFGRFSFGKIGFKLTEGVQPMTSRTD